MTAVILILMKLMKMIASIFRYKLKLYLSKIQENRARDNLKNSEEGHNSQESSLTTDVLFLDDKLINSFKIENDRDSLFLI